MVGRTTNNKERERERKEFFCFERHADNKKKYFSSPFPRKKKPVKKDDGIDSQLTKMADNFQLRG